jgi:hypothetical protein
MFEKRLQGYAAIGYSIGDEHPAGAAAATDSLMLPTGDPPIRS